MHCPKAKCHMMEPKNSIKSNPVLCRVNSFFHYLKFVKMSLAKVFCLAINENLFSNFQKCISRCTGCIAWKMIFAKCSIWHFYESMRTQLTCVNGPKNNELWKQRIVLFIYLFTPLKKICQTPVQKMKLWNKKIWFTFSFYSCR